MTAFVVDTNVAVVANGRNVTADLRCQLTCVETLRSVAAGEVVAVDDQGEIMKEYRKRLNPSGEPGVGDVFFKHVLDNQYGSNRVLRVRVTPSADQRRGFDELPRNTFDPSDRKFLAVAVVAGATVLNATDSDWRQHASLTRGLGVEVCQLCPQYVPTQARRKR